MLASFCFTRQIQSTLIVQHFDVCHLTQRFPTTRKPGLEAGPGWMHKQGKMKKAALFSVDNEFGNNCLCKITDKANAMIVSTDYDWV